MVKEALFIVDDEPMHAQMMEDYLLSKYPQFTIFKFATGELCLENMDKKPSVIILDYHLDSVDKSAHNGAAILKFIMQEYEDIKVIMISGQNKIDVAIDCMRLGAYDYIVKNETSFVMAENAIFRLLRHRVVEKNLSEYKNLNRILIGGLIAIVAAAALLFAFGIIE